MEGNQGPASNNSSDFVRKLYRMLEAPQDENVVRWGKDGDSFVVLENEKFTKHILPKHFKHSNFASFVRQLNKYDFHKVRHTNEEGGPSPYGAGAWEFKHPDFKINNQDALDNIRRKAPAPRRPNTMAEDMLPMQQIDMVNTQLVATQQQLQQLQERYNELSKHHVVLIQEMVGVQKTVMNHENVMQHVMSFLNGLDTERRQERRTCRAVHPASDGLQGGPALEQASHPDDNSAASPLAHANKLLTDVTATSMLDLRGLEQISEQHMSLTAALTTPPPDVAARSSIRTSTKSTNLPAPSSTLASYGELDTMVYPIGSTRGIDPMYSEHVKNIPYPLPQKPVDGQLVPPPVAKKKNAILDPGWVRSPQILLVEDDQTCRRIGGKFLYAFQCTIDNALDGLEAVNKVTTGGTYDLILMDIIMPNLDGVSATHLIRQFNSTPIIAMTSNIRSDDIAMYFQHGMNDVLPKPFTKEGLVTMLEKHLGHLKKHPPGLDPMGAPSAPLSGAKRSMKSEDSPVMSAGTASNWNSPGNIAGISPASNQPEDPHMFTVPNPPGASSYQIPAPLCSQPLMGAPSRPVQGSQPRQRRSISDIAGGPPEMPDSKRHMYTPAHPGMPMQPPSG